MIPSSVRRPCHGAVMFHPTASPDSRIWRLARSRGEDIALYTERRYQRYDDEIATRLWAPAATIEADEASSLFLDSPVGMGERIEYARYEPRSERRFVEMCGICSGYRGSSAIALPGTVPDEEAMRLLAEMQAVEVQGMRLLHESFYITGRHNLRREGPSGERLSRILNTIRVNDSWAYFLGFFDARDGVVVFLSSEESEIEALFPPADDGIPLRTQADWLYDRGVIERW